MKAAEEDIENRDNIRLQFSAAFDESLCHEIHDADEPELKKKFSPEDT